MRSTTENLFLTMLEFYKTNIKKKIQIYDFYFQVRGTFLNSIIDIDLKFIKFFIFLPITKNELAKQRMP